MQASGPSSRSSSNGLPELYFRIRDNGAIVFRIDSENRNRRLEMDQIAVVHLRKGEIRPHGGRRLSPQETDLIEEWITKRSALEAQRALDAISQTVDQINLTAQWVQTRASDTDLDQITDDLLMAMHDLRAVLVRKKAERLQDETGTDGPQIA